MLTGKIKEYDFKPHVLAAQVSRILTDAILEGVLKGGDNLSDALGREPDTNIRFGHRSASLEGYPVARGAAGVIPWLHAGPGRTSRGKGAGSHAARALSSTGGRRRGRL